MYFSQLTGYNRLPKGVFLFIVIFAILFLSSCENNPTCDGYKMYDNSKSTAHLAYSSGDFNTAFNHFKIAVEDKPKENVTDYLYLAASAFKVNEPEYAQQILTKSVTNTNCDPDYFKSFSELVPYHYTKEYKYVADHFDSLVNVYWTINQLAEVERRLKALTDLDQEARNVGDSDLMRKTDSTNIAELSEITRLHGWHPKGWLILWHQRGIYPDGDIWPYFKDLINKEIQECKVHPGFWAGFEDFYAVANHSRQIYGMYPHSFDQFPLWNVEKVDSLRESIGLDPLWYMNRIYDWPLPPGYVKPLNQNSFD